MILHIKNHNYYIDYFYEVFFFYKKLFFDSCEKYTCLFYCIHFLIKYLKEIHIYTWDPYIHTEKCKNDFYHWIIFTIYFINFTIVKIKISWSQILHDINKICKNKINVYMVRVFCIFLNLLLQIFLILTQNYLMFKIQFCG